MDQYAHLQALPNSPLTPLTPLSENTAFEFNFGGDGSLDPYIHSIRQKHRMERLQQTEPTPPAKQKTPRKDSPIVPTRFSERFLKIRDVFEPHTRPQRRQPEISNCRMQLKDPPKQHCNHQQKVSRPKKQQPLQQHQAITPRPAIKIVHTGATPHDYVATPTNVRTPLKQRHHNVILTVPPKISLQQHQNLHKEKPFLLPNRMPNVAHSAQTHHFLQASPVAGQPLSHQISKILHQRGLSMYSGVFQREEIDLFSFKMLELHDLHQMGIINAKHCDIIMADVCYARQCL